MTVRDTRSRILESARGLMAARGYARVGVAEICHHAGVRKGSFYHFFPSKEDLTLAVLDGFAADFKEQVLDVAFDPEYPPMDRIHRLGNLVYELQRALATDAGHVIGCPMGNLALETANYNETLRRRVELFFKRLGARLGATLQEAVDSGAVRGIDVPATAAAMVAYYEGVMLLAKTSGDPGVIRRLMPAMAGIAVRAGAGDMPPGADIGSIRS